MSSSARVMAIVDLRDAPVLKIPVPTMIEGDERATTIFSMASEDSSITLIGTYDQFLNFAASIGQRMMAWPIVSGHSDWLGADVQAATESGSNGDNGSRRTNSESEDGRSGTCGDKERAVHTASPF